LNNREKYDIKLCDISSFRWPL